MPVTGPVIKGELEQSHSRLVPDSFHHFKALAAREPAAKQGIAESCNVRGRGYNASSVQWNGDICFRFSFSGIPEPVICFKGIKILIRLCPVKVLCQPVKSQDHYSQNGKQRLFHFPGDFYHVKLSCLNHLLTVITILLQSFYTHVSRCAPIEFIGIIS